MNEHSALEKTLSKRGVAAYPPDHQAGMRVPKGGSSCAKCEYLRADRKTCSNSYFIRWNGTDVIPAPVDEYCSDYFEPAAKWKD